MLRRAFDASLRLIVACAHERRGQVAITFGLSALPAVIMTGAAIDYSRGVAQRSNLQQASDSTVLAMAHTYLTSSATCSSLYGPTQTYLTGTMNSAAASSQSPAGIVAACAGGGALTITGATGAATLQSIIISQNNTQMCIKSTMVVPTQMMNIVNVPTMTVGAYSCSQVGGTYEVALVMDNSYSMIDSAGSGSKMQAAQQAAIGLVQALIPSGTTAPSAAISLTPFNALVNVAYNGVSSPPAFMDTAGASSLNWINPKTTNGIDPSTGSPPRQTMYAPSWITGRTPSKFDLLATLKRTDGTAMPWGGCVEDRPNNTSTNLADKTNYMTTDIAATAGDSMFVPYFAPDDPGETNIYNYGSNYFYFSCYTFNNNNGCPNASYNTFLNSYIGDNGVAAAGASGSGSQCAAADVTNDNASKTLPGSGMTMSCRYKGATTLVSSTRSTTSQWFNLDLSPNSNCSTPAITPLTTNQTTLINAINAMSPTGLTNLGTGFMWGWRTVSGLTTPFFPGAATNVTKATPIGPKIPVSYTYQGPPSNTKVMILMTDGENSWAPFINSDTNNLNVNNPYGSSYESFGFMSQGRLSNYSTTCSTTSTPITGSGFVSSGASTTNANGNWAAYRCQEDNMLLEACTNAKAAGILVYTVGFATSSDPIDQEGLAVLQNCATSPAYAFTAANSQEIVTKFQQIAASITNLRISQ